jgi:catechol 2,3-dioxygenase-like lactoylglutathione lyase family enzyme
MKIYVTSVFIDDQQKAQEFYTEKLGFEKNMTYLWATTGG